MASTLPTIRRVSLVSSCSTVLLWIIAIVVTPVAHAEGVAQFKVAKGSVYLQRGGQRIRAEIGTHLQATDTVVTGSDGAAGITFIDNSLLSIGPNSELAIERYAFNSTTHEGSFESSLRKGTLSVVSGKIAKQSPDAMKVRTPSSILGVRGTEFLVRAKN